MEQMTACKRGYTKLTLFLLAKGNLLIIMSTRILNLAFIKEHHSNPQVNSVCYTLIWINPPNITAFVIFCNKENESHFLYFEQYLNQGGVLMGTIQSCWFSFIFFLFSFTLPRNECVDRPTYGALHVT